MDHGVAGGRFRGLPMCSSILYTFVVVKTGFTGIRSPSVHHSYQ